MKRIIVLSLFIMGIIGTNSIEAAQRISSEFNPSIHKNKSAEVLAKKAKRFGILSQFFRLSSSLSTLFGDKAIALGKEALNRMKTHPEEYSQATLEKANQAIKLGEDSYSPSKAISSVRRGIRITVWILAAGFLLFLAILLIEQPLS